MVRWYKWDLRSAESMSQLIQEISKDLGKSLDRADTLYNKMSKCIKELKEIKPEIDELQEKASKLDEYEPTLPTKLGQKKEKASELTASCRNEMQDFLKHIHKATSSTKKIMHFSNSLLYKESKKLDSFAKKINSSDTDSKLREELLSRINHVKEDMKTTARKIYEAATAEDDSVLEDNSENSIKKPVSDCISALGVAISDIGKILETLDIDDIDHIVSKSEEEMESIKKIALDCIIVLSKIDRYHSELEEGSKSIHENEEIKKDLGEFDKYLSKVKNNIKLQAGMLLEDIKICPVAEK